MTALRPARYAPRAYDIERHADGGWTIANPRPFFQGFTTANAALDHWAQAAPARPWLAERSGAGWRRVSFSEARNQVAVLAGALAELGVGPGRPLLILARNGIDNALVTYAAMRLGAAAAPVSPQYGHRGADLSRLAHAAALLHPAAVYAEDAAAAAEALEAAALQHLPVISPRPAAPGQHALAELLARGAALADQASPDQPAKFLMTSGSTGRPKAVICTHANLALNAAQIAALFDDPEPPVLLNSAPWNHSLGGNAILHMALHRGGTLHVDAGQPVHGRFGETLRNLAEVSVTQQNMVPAGWALLAPELERDRALARAFFGKVRILQYGGAGLAQSLCDRIQAVAEATVGQRITFAAGYGATETGPTACTVHWETQRVGLIGMPIPGTSVRLSPQDGKLELRVRGPQLSPGYLAAGAGAPLPLALDAEGYCRMGDAVRFADPEAPSQGLAFDGRLAENFKLATGAFVTAGGLRLAALSAIGGGVLDAVVCGEGRAGVGLMLFADPGVRHALGEEAFRDQVRAGLRRLNARAAGSGERIARALVLDGAPDARSGEVTDKGYINQAMARSHRPDEIERLFADPPDRAVIVP